MQHKVVRPHPADDRDEEPPLDPAVERVRRKLMRFALVNLLILFVAIAAVVGAIAYRLSRQPARLSGERIEADLRVPQGAEVVAHSYSSEGLSLLIALPDNSREVLVFDPATGREKARYRIGTMP